MEWAIEPCIHGRVIHCLRLCGRPVGYIHEPMSWETVDMVYEARNFYLEMYPSPTLEEAKIWVEKEALNPPEKDTSKYGGLEDAISHHRELVARFKG